MLLSVAVVVGVILVVLLGMDLWQKKKMWKARTIPGPPALPIIGNLLLFAHCRGVPDLMEVFFKIGKEYNHFMRVWFGSTFIIFVAHPEYIESAVANVSAMKKPYYISFFRKFMGGVFTEEGTNWHELRRMVTTSLYKKELEIFVETFKKKSESLIEKLRQQKDKFIDPTQDLGNTLFDIGLGNFYGVESNRMSNNQPEILQEVERVMNAVLIRIYRPWLHNDFLYSLSSAYKKAAEVAAVIRSAIIEAVLKRKELKKKMNTKDDVDPNSGKNRTVYLDRVSEWNLGKGVNDPLVDMHMTMDIMVAGMETSMNTLNATLYHLAHHPEWQEKLYEEYCDVLGGGRVTAETMHKLTVSDMVINEVLRLHSPPFFGRVTTEDIQMGEHVVPKGAEMIFFNYGLHRNPEYWEKPNEFYPEHFSPEAVARRPKMSFIPFGMGSRKCPGNVYSKWVSKTLLSDIIMNFRVETDMPKDAKIKVVVMIMLDQNYSFKFIPRNT